MRLVLALLVIPKFIYSLWAYFVAILSFILGAFGYWFVSVFHRGRAERTLLRVNNMLAVFWGTLTGVRYKVKVPASIDWTRPAIYVVNHTSTLDMYVCSYAFRMGTRFLAKKELKKLPFLGFMFSRISIFVDRSSEQSRKEALLAMKELAANNISLCVFPEGTRNRGNEALTKFYDGAFRMAIHASLPVIPLVLTQGRELMPMNSWMLKPGVLHAEYMEPVFTENMSEEDVPKLKQIVYQLMYDKILETDCRFTKS